jgi:hypothetical protein
MVVFIVLVAIIRKMKRHGNMLVWMLASALAGVGAQAATPGNSEHPYSAIVDRNVFNLHPAPPPVDPSELAKSKVQIPKLTLNGITTILGKKIVFLTMPATKPGGQQQSLMLAEGQAQDDVEAKQIDEKAGVVKVNNHGENQTLDFEHDGTRPAGPAGNPASPAITIPPVPSAPQNNTLPMPQQGVNVIRPLRTLPSRSTPLSQEEQPLTPEQQTLVIEAQRLKATQDRDETAPLFPITEKTAEMMAPQ